MEASQKIKNVSTKTLESVITTRLANGEQTAVSSKCADVNAEMFNLLGVSRPILNYVIFCHQEDSNWPLEEGSKVKEKFDEIFNSAKYQKCLKNIKDVRKAEMDKAKLEKTHMAHYQSDKEHADTKKKELEMKNDNIEKVKQAIANIDEQLEPIIEQIHEVTKEEDGFGSIQKKLGEAQTGHTHVRNERELLEKQIQEVLPESMDEADIERKRDGIERETKSKENEMKELTDLLHTNEQTLAKCEKNVQKNAARIGQALEEGKQHDRNVKEREKLIEEASNELGLVDDGDFKSVLKREDKRISNQTDNLRTKNKERENQIVDQIDALKSKKTALETKKQNEQKDMMTHKKEIAGLRRQLNELEGAADKLVKIKKEWEEAGDKLEKEKVRHDLKSLTDEIEQEKSTIKQLDLEERKIKEERKSLEEKLTIHQKINHIEEDLKVKQGKLDKLLKKRQSEFLNLFEVVPDTKRLKNMWKNKEEDTDRNLKKLQAEKANLEAKISSKKSERIKSNKLAAQKNSRKSVLESKVGEVIGTDEDLEEEIVKLQENLELKRKELSVKEAGKFTYREMIEKMQKMDCPACPTCNRAFIKKEEAAELISDLEELIDSIPNKVKTLESTVKKMNTRLELLQKIRPEAHELKTLKKEVLENKNIIDEIDKEIKALDKSLNDDEELELYSSSASLLKQVSEDVQLIHNLANEVASLTESKEELDLQVDGGTGRNIEDVRKEEDEICEKMRVARKNLDHCQETVSSQTSLINDLESRRNKLTEKKLEIEGQQQQRSNMMEKKEELERKVYKTEEEVKSCVQQLQPVVEELDEVEASKRKCVQDGEKEVEKLHESKRNVGKFIVKLENLEENIQSYIDAGKQEEIPKLKKEKESLELKMTESKEEKKATDNRISQIKLEVSNQESRRRMYDDNLRLREYSSKEAKLRKQIRKLEQELEDGDWKKVQEKKERLTRQYQKLSSEKSAKEGQVVEASRVVKDLERELNQSKWKNAARLYKENAIKHKLRLKVCEDLDKYYRALDFAILKFHKEKMNGINKIIRELWKSTYKGNDIDWIEIRTTDDNTVSGGADKRKVYSYRVVMIKNETELDMRGRCSAGQKVLSSLIIRLALAETFSSNCGIIALDEPTTNLDRENIESLASALADIVNKRAAQRNFQLVVITHDEDFIQELSRCDQVQYFLRVSRNSKGLSEIRKNNVDILES